jgi:hypothetical protein
MALGEMAINVKNARPSVEKLVPRRCRHGRASAVAIPTMIISWTLASGSIVIMFFSTDSWPRKRRAILEGGSDLTLQLDHGERFDYERLFWGQQNQIILDGLDAVRRHEVHLHLGSDAPELLRELPPAHERHHDVRQEQMEGSRTGACDSEGLTRVPGAQDGVPRRSQDVRGQGENLRIVIDEEDRFRGLRR